MDTAERDKKVRATKKTVVSGIQANGALHIGNYVGAISVWAKNQNEFNNLFFLADLHALTVPNAINPEDLRLISREVAACYIACGIDPKRSIIFLQSHVSAHPYLGWILTCCTPVGWLERMTQYKAKAILSETVGAGLLTYPSLQAADILLYKADYVPVGEDQKQHVELTRDIAQRFNTLFGSCFKLPEPMMRSSGARIMGLDDPTVKMSKSLAKTKSGHAIGLLDSPEIIRKKIKSAVTDPGREVRFEQAAPGVKNLLVLFEALSGDPRNTIEERFADRGYGYLKEELTELVISTLDNIQKRYQEIMQNPSEIDRILSDGAERASAIAEETISEVNRLTGVGGSAHLLSTMK